MSLFRPLTFSHLPRLFFSPDLSIFSFFFDIQTTQTLSSLLRTSRIFKVNATVDRWELTVEQLVTMAVVVRKKSLVG